MQLMLSRYDGAPSSSRLIGDNDSSTSIAVHLARKFKAQVFVSYTLPPLFDALQLELVKLLIMKLQSVDFASQS